MGTNYYLHAPPCQTCNHSPEPPLHIGKSSYGWVFAFQRTTDLRTLLDWTEYLDDKIRNGYIIKDEYGTEFSGLGFLSLVIGKSLSMSRKSSDTLCETKTIVTDHIEGEFS